MPAKKEFKSNNPALNFISVPTQNAEHTDDATNTQYKSNADNGYVYNTQNTSKTDNADIAQIEQNTQYTYSKQNTYNTEYMHNTSEIKSKRLNLLIRPSLHQQAQKIAHMQRSSVNDVINLALSRYVDDHREEIARYNSLYDE